MDNDLDLKILQVEPSKEWQEKTLSRLKVLKEKGQKPVQRNYFRMLFPLGFIAFSFVLVATIFLARPFTNNQKKNNDDTLQIIANAKYPFEITDTTQMFGGSRVSLNDRNMMAESLEGSAPETTESLEFTESDDYTTKLDNSEDDVEIINEQEAKTSKVLEKTIPALETNLIRINLIYYSYGPAICTAIDQGFRENRSITKLRITGEKNIFAEIEEKIIPSPSSETRNNNQNHITLQVINEKGSKFYTKTFDGFVDSYELENVFQVWNQAFSINFATLSKNAKQTGFNAKWNEIEITDKINLDCENSDVNIKDKKVNEQEISVVYLIDKDNFNIKERTFYLKDRMILRESYLSKDFEYTDLLEDWNKINSEWAFGDLIDGIVSDLDSFIEENFKDNKV